MGQAQLREPTRFAERRHGCVRRVFAVGGAGDQRDSVPEVVIDMVRRVRAVQAFTLIELLVVLAIIATLLTIVVPQFFGQTDKARETVLRENLSMMRDSIDRFRADQGRYPETLDELVTRRYLREVPMDTVTQSR